LGKKRPGENVVLGKTKAQKRGGAKFNWGTNYG